MYDVFKDLGIFSGLFCTTITIVFGWIFRDKIKQLVLERNQSQHSGDHSLNFQSQGQITFHHGMTANEVIALCKSQMALEFSHLKEVAKSTATERAQELITQYYQLQISESKQGLKRLADPRFQESLFIAQKEYAKSGEQDLMQTLARMLVDQSEVSDDSFSDKVFEQAVTKVAVLQVRHRQLLAIYCAIVVRGKQTSYKEHIQAAGEIFRFINPENLKRFDLDYMEANGLITRVGFAGHSGHLVMPNRLGYGDSDSEDLQKWRQVTQPWIADLERLRLGEFHLTPIGACIGVAHLKILGKFQGSISEVIDDAT